MDFDTEAHPALNASISIDLQTRRIIHRDYSQRENPPILHRKETFVTPDYPLREEFAQLTQQEEKLGLLKNKSDIGTVNGWAKCLEEHGVEIRGHSIWEKRDGVKS